MKDREVNRNYEKEFRIREKSSERDIKDWLWHNAKFT
jgi:hypothetical protein